MMNRCGRTVDWAKSCLGVDFQDGCLVVVRGERTRRGIRYSPVSPSDPSWKEALEDGTPVVACMSVRESLSQWIETPFSSLSKAAKVLPTLLDIELPFALEDCAYCFLGLRKNAGVVGARALGVAARRENVDRRLEVLQSEGIDPLVLDHEGLALWTQSIRETPPGEGNASNRVIVSLGVGGITLVIGRDGEYVGAHGAQSGDAGEIGRLLRAGVGDGDGGTAWFWTGPGVLDAERLSVLRKPLLEEWPGESFTHDEPGTFLARALVTRALLHGPLCCNLRSGSLTHPLMAGRSMRQDRNAALLLLAAGVLLCAANFAGRMVIGTREKQMDSAFTSLTAEVAGHPVHGKGEHALTIVEAGLERRREQLQPFVRAFEPSLTGIIESVIAIGEHRGLRYHTLLLGRNSVLVTGVAPDWGSCDELTMLLSSSGFPAEIDREDALQDGLIPFSISTGGAGE